MSDSAPIRLAWLGRPPRDCTHTCAAVADLREFATLRPLPIGLVVDLPDEPPETTLGALATPVLREQRAVVLVDTHRPELAALAAAHDIVTLARDLEPARRDAVLKTLTESWQARRHPDALLLAAARTAQSARFELRTLEQAEGLATLLSHFCSEPERRVGGFLELLINAIEHGNLEVSGAQKRTLLAEGTWHSELLRRLDEPQYAQRSVRVTVDRTARGIEFSVEDDGAGFDAAAVLACALDDNTTPHGRGIALARLMSFDELTWQGRGNRVVGRISA